MNLTKDMLNRYANEHTSLSEILSNYYDVKNNSTLVNCISDPFDESIICWAKDNHTSINKLSNTLKNHLNNAVKFNYVLESNSALCTVILQHGRTSLQMYWALV